MPWQQRGSRSYFYRAVRRGGRSVSVYVSAADTDAAAAEVEQRKAERARQTAERHADQQQFEADAAALLALADAADRWTRTALAADGWYLHARSEWRRRSRRGRNSRSTDSTVSTDLPGGTEARPGSGSARRSECSESDASGL